MRIGNSNALVLSVAGLGPALGAAAVARPWACQPPPTLPVAVGQARSFQHPRAAEPALDGVGVQAHRQALHDELA